VSNSRTAKIPITHSNNNNDLNDSKVKEPFKLVDNTNLKIIEELVKNPSTSSASLASKLEMPLSSLQRRRSKLEKSVLLKSYHIDLKASGGKMGDAVIKENQER
jgi:hypothetical protein